jgi:hypothetical protein
MSAAYRWTIYVTMATDIEHVQACALTTVIVVSLSSLQSYIVEKAMNIPAIIGVGIDVEHLLALRAEDTAMTTSVTLWEETPVDGDEVVPR